MRLSPLHALYWASRRAPAWAVRQLDAPSIDACINAHAGPEDGRRALPPALTRPAALGRRRAQLLRIASEPSIGGRRSRDAANARRWLKRLQAADAWAWWRGRAGLTGEALTAYDCASMVDHWRAGPGAAVVACWRESHMVKFHDAESHENPARAYQREFLNAMEKAPLPLTMEVDLFDPRRYCKD